MTLAEQICTEYFGGSEFREEHVDACNKWLSALKEGFVSDKTPKDLSVLLKKHVGILEELGRMAFVFQGLN